MREADRCGKKAKRKMKMNSTDLSKVVPTDEMRGDSESDTTLLKQMLAAGKTYLRSFRWCDSTVESYFGLGVGGVVAVFLFRIGQRKRA